MTLSASPALYGTNAFTNSTSFNVGSNFNSTINVPEYTMVNKVTNISGVVTNLYNAKLNISINGKLYAVITDNFGVWSLNYTPSQLGNHTVIVHYVGSPPDYYDSFTNKTTLIVYDNRIRANSSIRAKYYPNPYTESGTLTLRGELRDEYGTRVPNTQLLIRVGGEPMGETYYGYVTTDKQGEWSLNCSCFVNSCVIVELSNHPFFYDFCNSTEIR